MNPSLAEGAAHFYDVRGSDVSPDGVCVRGAALSCGTGYCEVRCEQRRVRTELTWRCAGLDFTIFRLYNFMENFFGNKQSITHMKTIFGPVEPSAPFTPISVQDIGEFVAAVLASPAPYSRCVCQAAR
jgi:hypothetical protein